MNRVHFDSFKKGAGRWMVYDYKLHAADGPGFVSPRWSKGSITADNEMWSPDIPENSMVLPLLFYFEQPVDLTGAVVTADVELGGAVAIQDLGFWIVCQDNRTRWHCRDRLPAGKDMTWDLGKMKWVRGWVRSNEASPRAALEQVWSCGFSLLEDMEGRVTLKRFEIVR